jgi:hypothetical protein
MAKTDTIPPPKGHERVDPPFLERLTEPFRDPNKIPPPKGHELVEPQLGEIATQVPAGVVEGASQGLPFASAMAGTMAGVKAGIPGGPPFMLGLGLTGMVGGYLAGKSAQSSIKDLLPPPPTKPSLVPYRVGSTTMGEAIGMAPAAYAIPVKSAQEVSKYIARMSPVLEQVPAGMAAGKAGKFIVDTAALIGETARKYPKSFLSAEVTGATGAGVGGGLAESYAPGEAGTKLMSEVAGGILFPGRLAVGLAGTAKDFVGKLFQSVSKESREGKAANTLFTFLEKNEQDIPVLIKKLLKPNAEGTSLTAAQKTGSVALSELETLLAKNNAQYGATVLKQGEDGLRAYKLLVQELQNLGTLGTGEFARKALVEAAEKRQTYFDDMLRTRLDFAHSEAARRISKITKDTPQTRVAIGTTVKNQTESALKDFREHERFLWQNASKESVEQVQKEGKTVLQYKQVTPSNTVEEFLEIATSMTPERLKTLPAELRSIMARLGADDAAIQRYSQGKLTQTYLDTGKVPPEYLTRTAPAAKSSLELPRGVSPTLGAGEQSSIFKDTSVNDLVSIRGDLLAFTRNADAKGEAANVNFYGRLAESALQDLDTLQLPVFTAARQFSRTLNDTITRTYAGDVATGVTKTGAEKIPAEILVSRAFGSNADTTAMRMNEIQNAVGMMRTQYDDAVARFGPDSAEAVQLKPFADLAAQRVDSIGDAQQRVLRLAAAKTIDPITGRVNQKQLTNFVNENRAMLDKFGVTSDLQDALRAENAFQSISQQNSYANKTLLNQTAFAQVLQNENPAAAITSVLKGSFPVKNFSNIVRLARTGSPEAVEGLKSVVFDYAFTKAGGFDKFNVNQFRAALFEPVSPGQPSILNIMRSQNIISNTEVKNILSLIRPMEKIEKALGNKQLMDDIVNNADAVTEFGLRVYGARMGAAVSGSGSSLIAASAGSQVLRNLFDKAPNVAIRGIIEEATKDPVFMALLLQKGKSESQKIKLGRQLHGYLGAAGLNYAEFEEPPPEQQAPARPGPSQSQQMLRTLPPAPPTRGMPNLAPAAPPAAPAQGPKPPGPQGAAQPPSQSRQMLSALFPEDRLLAMPGAQ